MRYINLHLHLHYI